MANDKVTGADIDRLLAYLPHVSPGAPDPVVRWAGGEPTPDGSAITMPYPRYRPEIEAFFGLAGRPPWADYGYRPEAAAAMLDDDATIAGATLPQIRSMLTYCVRGERFADGHWAAMIQSGKIAALLHRLAALRQTL